MIIEKSIVILDNQGKELAHLLEKDGINDAMVETEINGNSTLTFSMPADNDKVPELYKPDIMLVADDRRYLLMTDSAISHVRRINGAQYITISAVEKQFSLSMYTRAYNSLMLLDRAVYGMVSLLSKSTEPLYVNGKVITPRFPTGTMGYALQALLVDTGWEVGVVDANTELYDLITDKMTVYENIMQAINLWGGMLFWDSKAMKVDWRSEASYAPYRHYQVQYQNNIQEIERTQSNEVYTRIYPRGNNYLNIAGVNGGVEYLQDFTYSSKVHEKELVNPDIYSQAVLLVWGREQLKKYSKPRNQYRVVIIDDSLGEDFSLGDVVDLVDSGVVENGKIRQRIIKYAYNYFLQSNCELTIGDVIGNFEKLFRDLTMSSGVVDDIVGGDGVIGGGNIDVGGNPDFIDFQNQYLLFEVQTTTALTDAYAAIELVTSDVEARLTLMTEFINGEISKANASIELLSTETEAQITSLTEFVNNGFVEVDGKIVKEVSKAKTEIIQYSDANYASVGLLASYATKNELGQVSNSIAGVDASATRAEAMASLYASWNGYGAVANGASIIAAANADGSFIQLKADKVNIDGKTLFNGSVIWDGGMASLSRSSAGSATLYAQSNLLVASNGYVQIQAGNTNDAIKLVSPTFAYEGIRINKALYLGSGVAVITYFNGRDYYGQNSDINPMTSGILTFRNGLLVS